MRQLVICVKKASLRKTLFKREHLLLHGHYFLLIEYLIAIKKFFSKLFYIDIVWKDFAFNSIQSFWPFLSIFSQTRGSIFRYGRKSFVNMIRIKGCLDWSFRSFRRTLRSWTFSVLVPLVFRFPDNTIKEECFSLRYSDDFIKINALFTFLPFRGSTIQIPNILKAGNYLLPVLLGRQFALFRMCRFSSLSNVLFSLNLSLHYYDH